MARAYVGMRSELLSAVLAILGCGDPISVGSSEVRSVVVACVMRCKDRTDKMIWGIRKSGGGAAERGGKWTNQALAMCDHVILHVKIFALSPTDPSTLPSSVGISRLQI